MHQTSPPCSYRHVRSNFGVNKTFVVLFVIESDSAVYSLPWSRSEGFEISKFFNHACSRSWKPESSRRLCWRGMPGKSEKGTGNLEWGGVRKGRSVHE